MRTVLALLLIALLEISAVALTTTHGLQTFTSESARQLEVATAPVALPKLRVLARDGAALSLYDPNLITLLGFIYTRCTTICKALGSEFQQLQTEIQQRGLQNRIRLVSISFDPAHDTPTELAAYAQRQRADPTLWQFGTLIDNADLATLLTAFGIVVIDDGMGGFEHNATIHVVDQRGRLIRILAYTKPKDALAVAINTLEAADAANTKVIKRRMAAES